jgi:hypothetical protein
MESFQAPTHYEDKTKNTWWMEWCIDMMTGNGQNQKPAAEITGIMKTLNIEFRKAKGHNNDQWNDAADALAVRGRDEVINWPKCSFDVIIPSRSIAFREKAMRDHWTIAEVLSELKKETEEKLPLPREVKAFKG